MRNMVYCGLRWENVAIKNKKSGRQISQAIISKLFSEHPDIYPCQTIRKKLYLFSFYLYLIHFGYLYVYPRPF